jgi:hypothetical protein
MTTEPLTKWHLTVDGKRMAFHERGWPGYGARSQVGCRPPSSRID